MNRQPRPRERSSPDFLVQEEIEDRRTLRVAAVLAVLIHVGLFLVTFPELTRDVAEARSRQVFVVHPVQHRPPIDPRQTMPRERARRVPIPDPTPEDPEPLLQETPALPVFEVPTDIVGLGLPLPPPPAAEEGPVEFHSEMVRPVRIAGAEPQYTEIARRARLEGVVIVRAVITRDGLVRDVSVVKPLGLGLEQAAVSAVEEWVFEPARLNGEPVDVIYRVTVRFNLR